MSNISAVVNKYFTIASETYENNLSGSISALAVTVPVNSANEYADGDNVVLTVEPGTGNEATFVGTKASLPDRFVNCQWTEGNLGVGHASGVTIVDYDSATHHNLQTKGLKVAHNDDGTLKTTAVQAALNISSAVPSDYTSLAQTATTVTALGNRSYSLLFPGVNYTDRLSPGMRLRTVRSVDVNGQAGDFEFSSSQYASKAAPAAITFTDDFTIEGWLRLESYTAGYQYILGRRSGAPGWGLAIDTNGRPFGYANNGATEDQVQANQSVPLSKWTHVAMTWDISASVANFYLDGVLVPMSYTLNGATTTVGQAGDLRIAGNSSGLENLDGMLKELRLWNTVRTQAQIRDSMSQSISPSTPNLIGYWKLDGNFNDSTANANNMTAVNGAIATAANAPWCTQANGVVSPNVDYGIVQQATYAGADTTVIVQVPEGCTLPTSGGIASVSYSQFKTPYGFPAQRTRWSIAYALNKLQSIQGAPATNTWYNIGQAQLLIPIGEWIATYNAFVGSDFGATGVIRTETTLSTANNSESNPQHTTGTAAQTITFVGSNVTRSVPISNTASTPYYLNTRTVSGGTANLYNGINNAINTIEAENALL